jgi:hypothetical protein
MTGALVVYESMFGNTEAVACAVAEGLSVAMPTRVVPVAQAPTQLESDVDLLVVAGPTHAFGMSRPSTRRVAVDQGAAPGGGSERGIREWLAALSRTASRTGAAAIDTRIRKRGVPGSAARGAARRLRRLGFDVAEPTSFYVADTAGPLLEGELRRARAWGVELALHRPGRTQVTG